MSGRHAVLKIIAPMMLTAILAAALVCAIIATISMIGAEL
jgi:hypothetical protein